MKSGKYSFKGSPGFLFLFHPWKGRVIRPEVRTLLSTEGSCGQWGSHRVCLMVVVAGGKDWREVGKTMKNQRKPPTPPDNLY